MMNASVREILDALLVRSRSAMWVVIFPTEQPETGFLKTRSPWGNGDDSEQPDWGFAAKYYDPVTGNYRGDWKIGLQR